MAEKEKQEKVILEREYIIPLRTKFRQTPRYRRTPKAIKAIKKFLLKHMQVRDTDMNMIKMDKALNEEIWFRGIRNPPSKIKVKARKMESGVVYVELVELSEQAKWKKIREDKLTEVSKKTKEGKEKKADKEEKEDKKEEKKLEQEKEKSGAEEGLKQAEVKHKEMKHETHEKIQKKPEPRKSLQR
jgi:Ribosomal protein L31E